MSFDLSDGAPPSNPGTEARLASLRALGILDTPAEADYDDIARLAAQTCGTPIGLISFVAADRQWFKARIGVEVTQTGLERSVCVHALREDGVTEIRDTLRDKRTLGNPLVRQDDLGMRFYAGAPLSVAGGPPLGTLCVLDTRPRRLSSAQRATLLVLARQVSVQLELRAALQRADAHTAALQRALAMQDTLRQEIDHRVKNSLQLVTSLLRLQSARSGNPEVVDHLRVAGQRVAAIAAIHEALYGASAGGTVPLIGYCRNLAADQSRAASDAVAIDVTGGNDGDIDVPVELATGVAIAMNEFVANALKYAFPDGRSGKVTVAIGRDGDTLLVELADDGVGYDPDDPAVGSGLGRAIIEASICKLGGNLTLQSGGSGTRLSVRLPV